MKFLKIDLDNDPLVVGWFANKRPRVAWLTCDNYFSLLKISLKAHAMNDAAVEELNEFIRDRNKIPSRARLQSRKEVADKVRELVSFSQIADYIRRNYD